jgi:hypothetical protein
MIEERLEIIRQPLVVIILNILAKCFYKLFLRNTLRNFQLYIFELAIKEFFNNVSVKYLLPS